MMKTVNFLPMCHHYILTPENNTVDMSDYDNVTIIPHPYPRSVIVNRMFFDYSAMLRNFDFQAQDFDFLFCHQPEIYHNVLNGMLSKRYSRAMIGMVFFHWVDSPKSKPVDEWPAGFWRQLEAIDISHKTFFHCDASLQAMQTNFEKDSIITLDSEQVKEKINYCPLSADPFPEVVPFDLPEESKGKKILVFNHRWAGTTGIVKLIEYTKELGDDYFIWLTDTNAKKPKAGNRAPSNFYIRGLEDRGEYAYLLQQAHASICFVDSYATWNLSVQDSIQLGTPTIAYNHPVMESVLGEGYPYLFNNKTEFKEMVELEEYVDWELPDHDGQFKKNLHHAMLNNTQFTKTWAEKSAYAFKWLSYVLNGEIEYKKDLLHTTHPKLYLSNAWSASRHYLLRHGARDDITSKYSKYFIPDGKEDEIRELVTPLIQGVEMDEPRINEVWHQEVLGEEPKEGIQSLFED